MKTTSAFFVSSLLLAAVAAVGCSDDASAPGAATDASTSARDRDDAGGSVASDGDGRAPTDGERGGLASACDAGEGSAAPSTPDEVEAWLRTRAYVCWAREPSVHPSAGPHGGNVRTYMNAGLVSALTTDGARPVGAVAVKELYGEGTTDVTGWAFMMKTKTGSAKDSWYWLETFGTTPGASRIEGQGNSLCEGCHSAGDDYTLSPFPLR